MVGRMGGISDIDQSPAGLRSRARDILEHELLAPLASLLTRADRRAGVQRTHPARQRGATEGRWISDGAAQDAACDFGSGRAGEPDRGAAALAAPTPEAVDDAARALAAGNVGPLGSLLPPAGQDALAPSHLGEVILGPVARRLGVLWEDDEVSFAQVGAALERLVLDFHARAPALATARSGGCGGTAGTPSPGAPAIFLASHAGETHTLGLRLVASAFEEAGWRTNLMPQSDQASVLEAIVSRWVDVLALTVSWTGVVEDTARLIRLARRASLNRHLRVLVGGGAVQRDPGLLEQLGADGVAGSAREALALAAGWVDIPAAAGGSTASD
jgi:MerR family transcriptional regulator, light-induced transcriptional regulator